jgi:hypothetical protein
MRSAQETTGLRILGGFGLILLFFFSWSGGVLAQPCDVTPSAPMEVAAEGSAVNIAINPLTGHPSLVWVGGDHLIYTSDFDGSTWQAPQQVDTGGVVPVIHYPDNYPPFALKGLALAIDSYGKKHLVVGDCDHLYHFAETAVGWTTAEDFAPGADPGTEDPHYEVQAAFDHADVLHVGWAINAGGEASGFGVRYARKDATGWSTPFFIARGPHIDMHVEPDGRVHVAWMEFHGFQEPEHWRNYQGHYRRCSPAGDWSAGEQATDEPPVGEIGPVAIHPAVTAGPDGTVHMVYPVDPANPTGGFQEDGHAAYIQREANGWTSPVELFPNATHAAFVEVAVDPAGLLYAISLNWNERYRVDFGTGFEPAALWESAGARWFCFRAQGAPAGAWIAYIAARWTGPVKTVLLERSGDCGEFCGDGVCGAGEDFCSCFYDCTNGCCIAGVSYAAGESPAGDSCWVCDPGSNRRDWVFDPTGPGCSMDGGVDGAIAVDGSGDGQTADSAPVDGAADTPDATPSPNTGSAKGGCNCLLSSRSQSHDCKGTGSMLVLALGLVFFAGLVFFVRRRRRTSRRG